MPAPPTSPIDRHQNDDLAPYIYKTSNYGATWTRITTGIPDGTFVRAVREDPKKKGLLYAGTERGVFVSFDDGAHWRSLQINLPITPSSRPGHQERRSGSGDARPRVLDTR